MTGNQGPAEFLWAFPAQGGRKLPSVGGLHPDLSRQFSEALSLAHPRRWSVLVILGVGFILAFFLGNYRVCIGRISLVR